MAIPVGGIGAMGASGAFGAAGGQSAGGLGAAGGLQDRAGVRLNELGPREGPSFGDTLKRALGEVSDLQTTAQDAITAFLRGDPVELHEVMAATAEAGIALELLIEMRNKVTEAYRAVINMQT
jgi:flagellar hook-basal body complex protein FliE